jgi:uncharacterized protein YciI
LPETDNQPIFIYLIRPTRPGFAQAPTSQEEEIMERHFEYLKKLLEEGTLIMAGPCLDRAFGVAIFWAENETAAWLITQNDPSVQAGVMKAEVHPYRISLWREPR